MNPDLCEIYINTVSTWMLVKQIVLKDGFKKKNQQIIHILWMSVLPPELDKVQNCLIAGFFTEILP